MEHDKLIEELVEQEWRLFQAVSNADGRADCQDNYREFRANRASQFTSWDAETLVSYREDLEHAAQEGRNLVAEKYARMMERTSPLEYLALRDMLPAIEPEARELAARIVQIQTDWQEALAEEYPRIFARSRAIRRESDSPLATSFETYLHGELLTFSLSTLRLYAQRVLRCKEAGENLNRASMEHMMRLYGYDSLAAAEGRFQGRIG